MPSLYKRASPGRLAWVAAGLVLLLTVSPTAAFKAPQKDEDKEVSLKLKADVQAGFEPLSINFTARLKNLDLQDERFCHAGTFLVRRMITGDLQIVAGEDPVCLHGPEGRDISPTFSHSYVVPSAGSYEFFAMVITRDGQRILSNGVPVRVLSSPAGD